MSVLPSSIAGETGIRPARRWLRGLSWLVSVLLLTLAAWLLHR